MISTSTSKDCATGSTQRMAGQGMRDGRTHLAHKAEHAIDLDTGAIVGVTVQGADEGDTTTIQQTLPEAAEQLEAVAAVTDDAVAVIEEVVGDKGYHSRTTVHDLETLE